MMDAEKVREAVAAIAATPMQMSLAQWQELSTVFLSAADEIDRLRKLAGEMAEQWASCEADRSPDDWRWFGPCQLMREGLALRNQSKPILSQ